MMDKMPPQWLLGRQPCCTQDSALDPDRRGRKGRKRSNIVGPYIPYNILQTKGEMCANFGWDWFRNVDLYKFHTNKQKRTKNYFIFIYKVLFLGKHKCKLSLTSYAMCSLKPHVSINTLKIINYSYFHSVMTYGLLFCGHSSDSIKIFRLQKKIIRSCWVLEVVILVENCFLILKYNHSLPSTFFLFFCLW
jgi:hypothetical protein